MVGQFVDNQDLGHILSNDSGVITERGLDSVRGADVSFYSFKRIPKGPLPSGYPSVSPDLIFELFPPTDRSQKVLIKTIESLSAGVSALFLVDPRTSRVHLYRPDELPLDFLADDKWSVPEIQPG